MWHRWIHARRTRGDRGISLVIVAGSVTAIVIIAALAIDGGQAYANRRQMQNAADVAAIAGTRYYAAHRWDATPPATVSDLVAEVRSQAAVNRSDTTASQLDCWMVDTSVPPQRLPAGAPIDICDNPGTAWSTVTTGAAGVEVWAARNQRTFLGSVAKIDALNARGRATATMQPLVATIGGTPFIPCTAQPTVPLLVSGDVLNPDAIGRWFALQGPAAQKSSSLVPDCGAGGNAFDGTGGSGPVAIDQWTDAGNGNPFSADLLSQVLAASPCTTGQTSATGCLVVLPIASAGRYTGTNIEMYIVQFAVFEVWGEGKGGGQSPDQCRALGNPAPKYCGKLIGPGEISNGTGGTGAVDENNPYLIKLVR